MYEGYILKEIAIEDVKALSDETKVGLLFCYKALKQYGNDYQSAYNYLISDEFKNSIYIIKKK